MKTLEKPISESEMLARLISGEVRVPPLDLEWTDPAIDQGPDATLRASWEGAEYRFVAEFKGRSTPKLVAQAIAQARAFADRLDAQPLVVVPYLSPERLRELERAGVRIGRDYPEPIVNHAEARTRALAALKVVSAGKR